MSKPMTADELIAILCRLKTITRPPWKHLNGQVITWREDIAVASCSIDVTRDEQSANAVFIAHAPDDIARLLAEVKRLELAGKATKGPWKTDEVVTRKKDFEPSYVVKDKDGFTIVDVIPVSAYQATAAHIAASSPDVVREDIEEILQLRKERDWLLREIVNTSDRQFCPMPDRYECLYHVGHECKSREVEMRVGCWRTAVECAVKYEEEKNNVE